MRGEFLPLAPQPVPDPRARAQILQETRCSASVLVITKHVFEILDKFISGSSFLQYIAYSVDWFISLLIHEEVLLVDLCERKILFRLKIYDRLR